MRPPPSIAGPSSRSRRPVPRRRRLHAEILEGRPLLSGLVAGYDTPGTTDYPNAALERIGEVILNPGEHTFYTGVVDPVHGYAYFGTTGAGTAEVIKVALGTNGAPPTRVGAAVMPSGEGYLLSSVIDPANGYAYFGASDGIVKIALGAGDAPPTRVGVLPIKSGESSLFGAVGDVANGYAYFEATLNGQEEVIKVALGAGNALPTRVGSVTLGPGNGWRALIDPSNGYAYFTSSFTTSPATIYKVSLGSGNAPPSLVGTLTLPASDGALVAAAIDPINGYAYYVGTHYNSQFVITAEDLVKVALGAGGAAPTRIGAIALPAHSYTAMLLDPSAGYATLSDDVTVPSSDVIKLTLGAGNALPSIVGQIALRVGSNPPVPPAQANEPQAGEVYVRSGGYDPGTGYDYFGTDSYPAQVIKVRTSLAGAIEGTKVVLNQAAAPDDVRFYSHAAAGDLRLAIYDGAGNLLWQSASIADNVANGWITAPVPAGTLLLAPGTYWLAFQTDSTANVAGDSPGNPGDGFEMLQDDGPFATTLANTQTTANDWSLALDAHDVTTSQASASLVGTDAATQGHWRTSYGADGYDIEGDTSATNPSLPSYATVSVTGASTYTWGTNTGSPYALQNAAANGDIAATWFSPGTFNINVGINDGKAHLVTLYALDWDQLQGWNVPRNERIDILDAATGTVLDTRTLSSFQGEYISWNIAGNVTIRVTNLVAGNNAVIGGIFFGAAASSSSSASFVDTDTSTQGHWRTSYGADGYDIEGDSSATNPSLPSYATVSVTGNYTYTWGTNTGSPYALQNAAANGDIAATWFSSGTFNINVGINDGKAHLVTLYALDWDQLQGWNVPRNERIDILDAATGTVLDTRTLSSIQGEYVSWNIAGNVTIRVTNLVAGNNAVVGGIFFGPAAGS